ncbi:MAG: cytidine deaminase [Bacillota bacterium]|nr:cytidine deaminase [Bacillota bacterium]
MIEIIREAGIHLPDAVFESAAEACFQSYGLKKPATLCLTLTDDAGIREKNRDFRDKDEVTDVLSFPSLNLSPQNTFDENSPASLSVWDAEQKAFYLGDILINVDRAREQAETYGHSFFREMTYLFVHGVFHLLGYDHMNKEDQLSMRQQEENALNKAFTSVSDEELLAIAREARSFAYVPYSRYRVGAALLAKDGSVYTGCNIENASFGLTNCAERTAVFKAVSDGNQEFEAIAIAADKTAPWPCGACRQVMSEFAPELRVLVTWDDGKVLESRLDQLLPHSFLTFTEDQNG